MALMWQSISFQKLDDGFELEYSVSVKYNSTKKTFVETTGQDFSLVRIASQKMKTTQNWYFN